MGAEVLHVDDEHAVLAAYPSKEATRRFVIRPATKNFEADSGEYVTAMLAVEEELGSVAKKRAASEAMFNVIEDEMAAITDTQSAAKLVAKAARKANAPATSGVCYCGCGGATKGGKFVPGHDAKVKGVLRKVLNGEADVHAIPVLMLDNYASINFVTSNPEYMGLFTKLAGVNV